MTSIFLVAYCKINASTGLTNYTFKLYSFFQNLYLGDDLITPVYIAPRRPTTTRPPPPLYDPYGSGLDERGGGREGGRGCDDEEDCNYGSGAGDLGERGEECGWFEERSRVLMLQLRPK